VATDRRSDAAQARIDSARERLQRSRAEIFAFAHALKGDYPADDGEGGAAFPRSRLMRALTGSRVRMLLGGAALAASVLRPTMLWRAGKLAGLLRPLLLRYVLPRLLRGIE
jgi:hypothetical protein